MTVKAILAHKGDNVVTIEPTATVSAATKLLSERRIGAVVVSGADRHIIGILSERDIVKALGARGAGVLDSPITDLMTRKVVTCGMDETIAELMTRMSEGRFRHVPVVEQGRLAGIISVGDIVKARLEEMEREQDALREYIRTA